MELFIKITQFILSFSMLVIIHEFGHFLFAKLFKTRVEKFYLFFNPWFSLFKFKRGETEYGIGWIPFGGYVKIAGMIDESMDTEQMSKAPEPYEFRAKPAWQRLLIMVGGVVMNVVLALVIYVGMSFAWGDTYLANSDVKYGYAFGDIPRQIGFRDGDKIIDVAGQKVDDANKIWSTIIFDQVPYVTVERDGQQQRIAIPEQVIAQILNLKKAEAEQLIAPRVPFVVGEVKDNSPAHKAGLRAGDSLVSFNGEPLVYFHQYADAFGKSANKTVMLGVARHSGDSLQHLSLPLTVSSKGDIGVRIPLDSLLHFSNHSYTFWQSFPQGIKRTGEELSSYGKQIKLIFSPKTEAYKSLGGVLAIGSIFPTSWDWAHFWSITAFLSIVLAVMNILPIPALDGGHVLFLLVEVITRRRPSDKFLEKAQVVGMVLIFALLILANGNDIYRFFIK